MSLTFNDRSHTLHNGGSFFFLLIYYIPTQAGLTCPISSQVVPSARQRLYYFFKQKGGYYHISFRLALPILPDRMV
jgi:hypothetical protein